MLSKRTLKLIAVSAAVSSISSVVSQNCKLILPNNPLSASGLATPFRLAPLTTADTCDAAAAGTAAFVQGAIIDTVTGTISVYNPLVINNGTQAAITPTAPTLPTNSVVALWFGFNGATLTLANDGTAGTGLTKGNCVNGNGNTIFGQFSYCNAPNFFLAARNAYLEGFLTVPQLGTAIDGLPCPTTRDWMVVDQDQSDNVVSTYLVSPTTGLLAQNTAANRAALGTSTPLANGSDNRLLDIFVLPTLGCSAWMVSDLADPGSMVPALPLNEIMAEVRQSVPQALVPSGDPMAVDNGAVSLSKINAYRAGVFQPQITLTGTQADTNAYCNQLVSTGATRIFNNRAVLRKALSPTDGTSLYDFLVARFGVTIDTQANGGVGCATLGILNTVNFAAADPTPVATTAAPAAATQTTTTMQLTTIEVSGVAVGGAVVGAAIVGGIAVMVKRRRNGNIMTPLSGGAGFYQL